MTLIVKDMTHDQLDVLFARTLPWGKRRLVMGELTDAGLFYLAHMGAKQSNLDTYSGWAKFVGYDADGKPMKDAVKPDKREKRAKELGLVGYNDADNDQRELLAEAHFGALSDNKLAKILDGTTEPTEPGIRLTPDAKRLFDMAEKGVVEWAAAKDRTKAKLIDGYRAKHSVDDTTSDKDVWASIVGVWLDQHRAEYETELARQKADEAKRAEAAQSDDFF